MVHIHVSFDQAASSGLFGRLVEERIKLVDASDKASIQKYHQLWSSRPQDDREPAIFFELTLSTEPFEKGIQRWREDVATVWLWNKWHRAIDDNEKPENIWLDRRRDEHGISWMCLTEVHQV